MNKFFFIGLILSISSCTLDYSTANIIENLSDEIPNTIISRYETIEIKNGSPLLQILAEKAEVYNSQEKTFLTNVEFYNYKENEINNQGISTYAVLNMKTGDAQLNGSIIIKSVEDEKSLIAKSLSWKDEEKTLSSSIQDSVTVTDGNGSTLKGQGFSADIRRKSILFQGRTVGEYTTDEN